MIPPYIIKTPRLGLRNWHYSDLATMADLNADPEVMEYFPKTQTIDQTSSFINRMQQHYEDHGFCYFAVDLLGNQEFIGFIGLLHQNYDAPFTPCIDIGWRLKRSSWGYGYATEGAAACLEFGFEKLGLKTIHSVASVSNTPSEKVMQKIGMKKLLKFDHPKLLDYLELKECVVYSIEA